MNPNSPIQPQNDPPDNPAATPARDHIQLPERQIQALQHVASQHAQNQPETPGDPYNRTHIPTYNWQQYHSAWQQYYQQYYHRYYTLYAQQLQAQQQAQQEAKPDKPETPTSGIITGSDTIAEEPQTHVQRLRADLLDTVAKRTNKFRHSGLFVPILSALLILLLFLGLQFNRLLVAQVEAFISPGSTTNTSDTIVVDPASNTAVSPDPKLIIPKINVDAPVIYNVTTVDDKAIQAALEKGVVHYNLSGATSVPGQNGNGVIVGHSSNDVFDPGNYKFTFLLLDRLSSGDLFYLNYQSKRYVYKVVDKKIISPTDWKVLQQDTSKPTMILATCTPAGTCSNRLLIYGQQISPDPATAAPKPTDAQTTNPAEIPGDSQTLLERLQKILF